MLDNYLSLFLFALSCPFRLLFPLSSNPRSRSRNVVAPIGDACSINLQSVEILALHFMKKGIRRTLTSLKGIYSHLRFLAGRAT
jgi:hypothetical protein